MEESTHVIQWSAITHIDFSNAGLHQERECFIFCKVAKKTFKTNCLTDNNVKKLSFNYCPLCGEKLEIAEGEKMEKNDQTKKVVQESDYNEVLNKNLAYINEHRANVKKALDKLVELQIIDPNSVIYEIVRENIYKHDLSKYQVEEFEPYARRFFIENGRELHKEEFDLAWLHHIHNNPHHWNYWVLVDGKNEIKALEMPIEYVWEMICDWLSFGFKIGDLTEIKSFNESKRKEYILHPNTRKLVDDIIKKIVDEVEKEKK